MNSFNLCELLGLPKLRQYLHQIDIELESILKSSSPVIHRSGQMLTHASSKRLRSTLLLSIPLFNESKITKNHINAGVAIELVHIGSLVHDDIIDKANTRWGNSTVNQLEGLNQAIVIGDYLLAKASEVASKVNSEVAGLVSSTISTLCEGESLELSDQFNIHRSINSYFESIKGKTASLISLACKLGGYCSGLTDNEIKKLEEFGQNFGIAFQIIDDLLDFISTEEKVGKPVCNDIAEGIYTLPLINALKGKHEDQITEWLASDISLHKKKLIKLLFDEGYLDKTIYAINKYNALAINAVKKMAKGRYINLTNIPVEYERWAMNNLTSSRLHIEL